MFALKNHDKHDQRKNVNRFLFIEVLLVLEKCLFFVFFAKYMTLKKLIGTHIQYPERT